MTKYYSLLVREDGQWTIQFGDYENKIVKQERKDMAYLSALHGEKQEMKIICTDDSQASIEKAVKELNERKA